MQSTDLSRDGSNARYTTPRQSRTYMTEIGSTMEQYREQGYENMVVSRLINPVKNWGIAVADEDYSEAKSLGQEP